ncbi:peptidase T [Fusibacter tunisiensis]|uniref:Peptidase T n=1 Tax=Fusibacter tunisiensis TaxID=1008308 RepID=A0ABS2MSG8_9FIRM|nr:peptidase T [Fusibacter tunisiensis]MBM7562310.1 tripeptide aminopeptidase [Fusibacter tunisiensis]
MTKVHERFLKYVAFDTESDPDSESCPSSEKQKDLGYHLLDEMKSIGIQQIEMDANGYVYGVIPASDGCETYPKLAFIAHMDTSPDLSGANVKARIVKNYTGEPIVLNAEKNIILAPEDFEHLGQYVGDDLIVTDGTTLLGADNKAGIAEILTMAEVLIQSPDIKHGPIKIAFTPDEEIGRGADRFDLNKLDADFGYTVDGGELGELEYENFNAATAKIKINGSNIHPGSAKGKMKNALLIGMEFHQMLPAFENPAYTEAYEGFSHLNDFGGSVEEASMLYIIRDHDLELFNRKKSLFESAATFINQKYGANTVELGITDSYFNMKEKILPHFHLIENAQKAMEQLNIKPLIVPVRGGTDGARLSYMGLPCPNLFTGGHNFHGKYEYIPIQSMEKAVSVLIEIVKIYAQ